MKLSKSYSKFYEFLAITFVSGLFVFIPLSALAQVQEDKVVGVFSDESIANKLADTMNQGVLSEGIAVAKVYQDTANGEFVVYVEIQEAVLILNEGCELNVSSPVARKGQDVTFNWKINRENLNCTEENDCGTISEITLQEKGVEGNSVTLQIETGGLYVLSGDVTDYVYYTEDNEEPEMVLKPVVCTVEMQVTNWFKWLLWKLFGIQP